MRRWRGRQIHHGDDSVNGLPIIGEWQSQDLVEVLDSADPFKSIRAGAWLAVPYCILVVTAKGLGKITRRDFVGRFPCHIATVDPWHLSSPESVAISGIVFSHVNAHG